MTQFYIGLMSGTSVDAIDAVLLDCHPQKPKLVATHSTPIPDSMGRSLKAFSEIQWNEIDRMCRLDKQVAELSVQVVKELLCKANISKSAVRAIGSHGQNIRHSPAPPFPYTLQISDPNLIAKKTGIITVGDFRRGDVALGGQGAPLVPAFHRVLADPKKEVVGLNLGGVANITLLSSPHTQILGFDTGPGNALLDAWIHRALGKTQDDHGLWARSGQVKGDLLERLLVDPYFKKTPPKSTGREYFNLNWLLSHLMHTGPYAPQDIQATLTELTAKTITDAIHAKAPHTEEVVLCGGGVHNTYLVERLAKLGPKFSWVNSIDAWGIGPKWIEASAFAWMAYQTMNQKPSNIPSVTGALRPTILGGVYYP